MPAVESPLLTASGQHSSNDGGAAEFFGQNGQKYEIVVLTDASRLESHLSEWMQLAEHSIDANPFYEPWFLLPAIKTLGQGNDWYFVLVFRDDKRRPGNPALCGFFPFHKSRGPMGISQLSLWKNAFCFLASPLIHQESPTETLRVVMSFLQQKETPASCLEWHLVSGEGQFHYSLIEVLRENLTTTYVSDQYLRARITCSGDTEEYFKKTLGGHHLREYRRKRRKLETLGDVEYRQLTDLRALDCWTDWFLQLEAQGWKARAGTAIQQNEAETKFFREFVAQGFPVGKVRLEGLFLNGEPIALKCILIAGKVAFAFKIAFDETYRNASPGVQLEFESLRELAADPSIEWSDSCAAPGHQMIDRLWSERRVIQSLTLSTGKIAGEIVLGALPCLRALNRVRKRLLGRSASKSAPKTTENPS
ncbi:GNAT family N-acetyltransferase [Planctomicrobium sp. SH668]|uniref:GNAT family N-acetyltransferase n=1 Tax=Planctomicrobium sp. SH668 TaxID=3448126 RepID=UPI003F5C3C0E